MISMIFLAVVLILITYLLSKDVLRREAAITIVTNLPLGIFKDSSSKKNLIKEENKSNMKASEKEKHIDIASKEIKNDTLEVILEENEVAEISKEEEATVYWTPNGKSYHMTDNCRTLSRSKVIHSGNMDQCEKDICCEQCKIKDEEK